MEDVPKSPGYTISCQNPDFQSKMHDVFSGINASTSNMTSSDSAIESGGEDFDMTDGGEELTSMNISASGKKLLKPPKPDFLVNPSRYTKYSLKDTELTDNKTNSQVAFNFLQQLSQHKGSNSMEEEHFNSATTKKHVFKMPEHIAGDPKPKERAAQDPRKENITLCDKVELEHLEENISAAEYRNEIASRLDEMMAKAQPVKRPSKPSEGFKPVPKKQRRNLRSKLEDED